MEVLRADSCSLVRRMLPLLSCRDSKEMPREQGLTVDQRHRSDEHDMERTSQKLSGKDTGGRTIFPSLLPLFCRTYIHYENLFRRDCHAFLDGCFCHYTGFSQCP